jgi:hypothetical protein
MSEAQKCLAGVNRQSRWVKFFYSPGGESIVTIDPAAYGILSVETTQTASIINDWRALGGNDQELALKYRLSDKELGACQAGRLDFSAGGTMATITEDNCLHVEYPGYKDPSVSVVRHVTEQRLSFRFDREGKKICDGSTVKVPYTVTKRIIDKGIPLNTTLGLLTDEIVMAWIPLDSGAIGVEFYVYNEEIDYFANTACWVIEPPLGTNQYEFKILYFNENLLLFLDLTSNGTLLSYRRNSKGLIESQIIRAGLIDICAGPNNKTIALLSAAGEIIVYNFGHLVGPVFGVTADRAVTNIALSPDGTRIAALSTDSEAREWFLGSEVSDG